MVQKYLWKGSCELWLCEYVLAPGLNREMSMSCHLMFANNLPDVPCVLCVTWRSGHISNVIF